ncbi:MAG TPA: VOC family protein [Baekduia sp.]|nr:VOC family protein [Baekduia sp.]
MDFTKHKPFSGFSVDDPDAARTFYAETLGFDVDQYDDMLWIKTHGDDGVLAYTKPDHEPALFTVLNLPVDDVDDAVDDLTARGVAFEHYDGDFKTDAKGIMRDSGPTIAWFRDPAGNVLSVIEAETLPD